MSFFNLSENIFTLASELRRVPGSYNIRDQSKNDKSCITHHKVNSYRTHQTSNNLNEHANLVQENSNARNINYSNLNYDRPDNWTEQNEYRTDSGHSKAYEEQGQYVDGSSHVRYLKKNYTSSYSATHVNNPDLLQQERLINQATYNSIHAPNNQRLYEQSRNVDSYRQEQTYNNVHSNQLQHSYRGRESHSGRLENFGGISEGSQVSQHGITSGDSEIIQGQNQYIETRPGNWSNVNTYRTDGGHGHVLEVEGQYVTGPKKVRYYKKNYTSHYSSNPEHGTTLTNVHNLQNEMQNLNQEFQNIEKEIYRQSHSTNAATSNTLNTGTINLIPDNRTPTFRNHNLQVEESANYMQRLQNEHVSPISTIHHVPVNQLSNGVLYRNPDIYTTNGQNIHHEKQEIYSSQYHTNISPNHIRIPISENNYQRYVDNKQILGQQNIDQNYQREHTNRQREQVIQNYESSGAYERGQYSSHHANQHHAADIGRLTSNNYNPGYTTNLGQLVTGALDLGHGIQHADCTHETQQIQHGYNRRYKRNADYKKYSEILEQEQSRKPAETSQHYYPAKLSYNDYEYPSLSKQYQNQNQQSEDLTQQTGGFDDLTQQTAGHLEFGQQTQQSQKPGRYTSHNQQHEDLTQQNEDLTQQTGGFDDLTQQTTGHLEFGQRSQKPSRHASHNQQHEDLTQQNEDLTQQTGGFDDLTQQTAGHLEFGQQTQHPQKPGRYTTHNQQHEDVNQQNEDLTQQVGGFDDLTQQTAGHLEFGQQTQQSQKPGRLTSHNQKYEDLNQQNEDFTQQVGGFDDLSQSTTGNLEFGQQSQKPGRYTSHGQQEEGLTQQINGLDFMQQPANSHIHQNVPGTIEQLDMNQNKPIHSLIPAPKPKWKPRYQGPNKVATDDGRDTSANVYHPIEFNDETTEKQPHGDQLSSFPKPNLQLENGFNSVNQPEILNTPKIQPDDKQGSQQPNLIRKVFTKGGHRFRHIYRQSSQYSNTVSNNNYENRFPQESQISTDTSQPRFNQNLDGFQKSFTQEELQQKTETQNNNSDVILEPRILLAYGGGPYDANHSDDIFNHVMPNPSATLPPSIDDTDPWIIEEKPKEVVPLSTTSITTTVIPEITEAMETEAPPNFWGRIAHKLTNTFDKAKEKAKDLFG
ncbi:hypothetical protein KPH14_008463 [Odynerus spinipes]|uniref:Uncharacterized protein n=1 Tax=Odynerus spinipes TaxID=1348599 RepID=A0AAD9RFF5_9HYME|nr:hypothetical protein KPH14_008463 [Odynerus spinipes]